MSTSTTTQSTQVELGDHPEPLSQLLFVCTTILKQALDLVSGALVNDDQLTTQSSFLPGSTIGRSALTLTITQLESSKENIYAMPAITLSCSLTV